MFVDPLRTFVDSWWILVDSGLGDWGDVGNVFIGVRGGVYLPHCLVITLGYSPAFTSIPEDARAEAFVARAEAYSKSQALDIAQAAVSAASAAVSAVGQVRRTQQSRGAQWTEKKRLRAESYHAKIASGAASSSSNSAPSNMCTKCNKGEYGKWCAYYQCRPCCEYYNGNTCKYHAK